MKTRAGGLESPYLDAELVLAPPRAELAQAALVSAEESPFVQIEHVLKEPVRRPPEEVPLPARIVVVDANDKPLTAGDYAFHQGSVHQTGTLSTSGYAYFGKIDPRKPFVFEITDRVCAIRSGAYLDPDDPMIEYGGTWFDWTLVRDNKNPEKDFWPYYQREMDWVTKLEAYDVTIRRRIDRFLQHEHITRRPIQIAAPVLSDWSKVRIRATPVELRTGPIVRYTDYQSAVIWLETVTPCMVRVTYKKGGAGDVNACYATSVRVGGRHFAFVEIDKLLQETIYSYTIDLAPLPGSGSIPVDPSDLRSRFPKKLTPAVTAAIKEQLKSASLDGKSWPTFRTLRAKYTSELRFATGSCRWYPGDKNHDKDWGPDMLDELGNWLVLNRREKWPSFLFFGGDQIYSDEIGDDTGAMLVRGRFASRIPGPPDPSPAVREKLVDGAWAGRFAHRYQKYKSPSIELYEITSKTLQTLDSLYKHNPEIKGIYKEYPEKDRKQALDERYKTLRNRRQLNQQKSEASDERATKEALAALPAVDKLETVSEPFRVHLLHWRAGFDVELQRNPMGSRYLNLNYLLWQIPDFEKQLPSFAEREGYTVTLDRNSHGHPAASGDGHAADFAEYAYAYERAWTTSRGVRRLFANVPTFLMFDDHEATDDWNFDATWVRMLHNPNDKFLMWPKTLTDALAAYWVYQGFGNKAPSQWKRDDPRVAALVEAQENGTDALPQLRKCIYKACFPQPAKDPRATFQAGLSLDWHYQLPFDPPFLVPDCRTRKFLVPSDEGIPILNHEDKKNAPQSRTIDKAQLEWLHSCLVGKKGGASVAFVAPSTPFLMQRKVMGFMLDPGLAARAALDGIDLASLTAAIFDSSRAGRLSSPGQLRLFRRSSDLEHMIRDRSWRDFWGLIDDMHKAGSPVKTLILVSGDVHHNYCMTANPPGKGRPTPELLQITCSGLQTTIRPEFTRDVAEDQGSSSFNVGKYRLVPGFMSKNGTGAPDLVLFENAVALVRAKFDGEVNVRVEFLSRKSGASKADTHVYWYTSGPSYLRGGQPAFSPAFHGRAGDVRADLHSLVSNRKELEEPIDREEESIVDLEPYAGLDVEDEHQESDELAFEDFGTETGSDEGIELEAIGDVEGSDEFDQFLETGDDADQEIDEFNGEDEHEPPVDYPKSQQEYGNLADESSSDAEQSQDEIFVPGATDRFVVLVSGYNYFAKQDDYSPLARNRARVIAAKTEFKEDNTLVFVWFSVAEGKVRINRRRGTEWKLKNTKDWTTIDEFEVAKGTTHTFAFEAINPRKHYAGSHAFKQDEANSVLSVVDICTFLSFLGHHRQASLLEFSVLSHGFWNGPILVNSEEQTASSQEARNPTDKDARGRKDFKPANLTAGQLKNIQDAFAQDGFSWIWGCFVSPAARSIVQGVADSKMRRTPWGKRVSGLDGAEYLADGSTPDNHKFRFKLGRDNIDAFAENWDSQFFPTGVDHFDKTFAEIKAFAKKHSDDTYCQTLAVATGKPCFGPPLGTSSNYAATDPYRPGTPVVHWVERGKKRPKPESGSEANYSATIEFFENTMKMSEDPEKRGYVRYAP